MAACDVTIQIVVRQAVGGAAGPEIFDGAMQRIGRQGAIDAFSLELLRAYFGAQVDREASRTAMLIERTGTHAGASEAQYHRAAIATRRGKELALELEERGYDFIKDSLPEPATA